MKTKLIAGLAGAALLAVAPLAFAQSIIPTTGSASTSSTGTTYTSPSTNTTGSGSTSTTGTTGTTSTTPGVPNTGAGGEAPANIALLVASAVVALGGAAYIARQKSLTA